MVEKSTLAGGLVRHNIGVRGFRFVRAMQLIDVNTVLVCRITQEVTIAIFAHHADGCYGYRRIELSDINAEVVCGPAALPICFRD